MTSESPERETAHVEQATIDVSSATIVQSPQSRQQARYLAYSLIVLFIFTIVIGAGNLLFTSNQVHNVQANSEGLSQANTRLNRQLVAIIATNAKLRQQILADCGFDRDLAGLPLANMPNGKPSLIGVKIISDSRGAWAGHGCPGTLPPPDPTFVAGAKLYRLPVN